MEETATLNSPSHSTQATVRALAAQEHWVWAAYILHGAGLLMFWPALIGLAVNYAKYGDGPQAAIDTHHRYLRRTFWIGLTAISGIAIALAISLAMLLAHLGLDIHAIETDTAVQIKGLSLEHLWVGVLVAVAAFFLLVTWLWALFRLIRGMVRLSQDRGAY
jgi:uncharacterized membrane protein